MQEVIKLDQDSLKNNGEEWFSKEQISTKNI